MFSTTFFFAQKYSDYRQTTCRPVGHYSQISRDTEVAQDIAHAGICFHHVHLHSDEDRFAKLGGWARNEVAVGSNHLHARPAE
ncbi:MAG: hypothetical protein HY231_21045 [Acidobacteria bacterium]|nr:hypothetical protein [Acidobacteriota bacterium]